MTENKSNKPEEVKEQAEDLTKLDKKALIQKIEELQTEVSELQVKSQIKSEGRKAEVFNVLKSAGHITVAAIATRLGISARNVSSQLTYLRKDGHAIATDSLGRKFLEGQTDIEPEKKDETESTEAETKQQDVVLKKKKTG